MSRTTVTNIKALFKCVKCGRTLGTYEGEEFYVVTAGEFYCDLEGTIEGVIEVVCKKCWKEEEGPTSEEVKVMLKAEAEK